MHLITVTIGRNVRAGYSNLAPLGRESGLQVPMKRHHWAAFQRLVRDEIAALRPVEIFGPFHGTGEWDGVSEDSVTFTALLHTNLAGLHADRFGEALAAVARDYDQDAIAWAVGESHLSGPHADDDDDVDPDGNPYIPESSARP